MSQDKNERTMQFILEQQAQFAADLQQLKELHAQAEKRMSNIENVVLRLANGTENRVSDLETKMAALVDAQVHTEQRMASLADSQAHADQRLNALIDIVQAGRDGKQ